jgi:dTDP-glucose 4,6-dehydratase
MRLLITGGAGFIGSTVVKLAVKKGYEVLNVDSLSYAACLDNLLCVEKHSNYSFEHSDIRDKSEMEKIFKSYQPNFVMHLAAESHVDRSIDSPREFLETNVVGTFNLLQIACSQWIAEGSPSEYRFHHVSTDEVYGTLPNDSNIKFTEKTPYDPRSPYSASKASSDHFVNAWHNTYNFPTLITNCSNNYGPYHFPEKLIPLIILNAISGRELPIYGDGMHIRDWLYVEDHAEALIHVLSNGVPGKKYNIGGENERTNLDIVKTLCSILDELKPKQIGSYKDQIIFVKDRPGHDERYAIDPSLIKNELGWSPSTHIEEGLIKTVKWYLDNEKWWKPLLTRHNISERLGASN